jgi:AcrR family transcriptional regulator
LANGSLAEQLRSKRSEMMISEVEGVALRLFAQRGFSRVTVEEIASEAQISVRTFYRYFPSKELVLHVRIERRSLAIAEALAARPANEAPMRAVTTVLTEVTAAEDAERVRQWVSVIASTPELVPGVLGGMQLKVQRVIAEFLAERLGVPPDALVPTMLAAAIGAVTHTAVSRWFTSASDLPTTIAAGLEVLQHANPDSELWTTGISAIDSLPAG